MSYIFFEYEEVSDKYIYKEGDVEYRMPLLLMLKFKKFSREHSNNSEANLITPWINSLTDGEKKKIQVEQLY